VTKGEWYFFAKYYEDNDTYLVCGMFDNELHIYHKQGSIFIPTGEPAPKGLLMITQLCFQDLALHGDYKLTTEIR